MNRIIKCKLLLIHCGTSYYDQLINCVNKPKFIVKELNFDAIIKKLKKQRDKNYRTKKDLIISTDSLGNYDAVIYGGGTIRSSMVPGIYKKIKLWSINYIKGLKVPFLGICLGHIMLGLAYGATYSVMRRRMRNPIVEEKGITQITFHKEFPLAPSIKYLEVYEDHERELSRLPNCLINTAASKDSKIQAIYHTGKKQFGVQFHPEVEKTDGRVVIDKFLKIIRNRGN